MEYYKLHFHTQNNIRSSDELAGDKSLAVVNWTGTCSADPTNWKLLLGDASVVKFIELEN